MSLVHAESINLRLKSIHPNIEISLISNYENGQVQVLSSTRVAPWRRTREILPAVALISKTTAWPTTDMSPPKQSANAPTTFSAVSMK